MEAPISVPTPQTPSTNLPTSSLKNLHHSVIGFTSPLSNDTDPLSNTGSLTVDPFSAGPSMPVQIAAARAHHENSRVSMKSFSHTQTKTQLVRVKDFLGHQNFCGPCWIQGYDRKHDAMACQNIACGWASPGSSYKSWRSRLQILNNHCFTCFLPQVKFPAFCTSL
jgi:hypothetical protein